MNNSTSIVFIRSTTDVYRNGIIDKSMNRMYIKYTKENQDSISKKVLLLTE